MARLGGEQSSLDKQADVPASPNVSLPPLPALDLHLEVGGLSKAMQGHEVVGVRALLAHPAENVIKDIASDVLNDVQGHCPIGQHKAGAAGNAITALIQHSLVVPAVARAAGA